jgi:hypothetical protein
MTATWMAAATVSAAMIAGESVFRTCTVASVTCVALPIASFVAVEVVVLLFAAAR